MRIAVLDYASGSVDIFDAPEVNDIEYYLTELRGYRLDEVYWMEVKSININI